MSTPGVVRRRCGGRAARIESRSRELPEDSRPVRPGMAGGARYRPLDGADMPRIHAAALDALQTIGIANPIPSCVEALTAAGCTLSDRGRVLFPRALVEDTVAAAARDIVLCGQTSDHDMAVGADRVCFGTAGAAVHMVDALTGEYRESTLADLYDAARLVDRLEHVHFFQRPMVARDLVDPAFMDLNTCYASVSGTAKHVGTSFTDPAHLDQALEMLHLVAGDEARWRARPFVSCSSCFVVPPYRWAEDACRVLEAAVRGGMPVLLLAAGQAGATSPASLAGAVVQEVAEVLAGLVYVNAMVPGHPAIFGAWPFISDLRTGAMSGGSGEQAVLMAACGQMGRYYDLPTGIAAGMSDSKVPDVQSGYERGCTVTLAAHSGTNLVYEAAGMQASLLGFCHESAVIDNDMLGAINRTVRGIEVDDASLSLEVMRNACLEGPEHYLGHDQTLALMQRDYVYPELGDRSSPNEWTERGRPQLTRLARERVTKILSSWYPRHIDDALDVRIRASLPIMLPREAMGVATSD